MNVFRCAGGVCMNSEHTPETCYQRYLQAAEGRTTLTYNEWLDAVNWDGVDPDEW